MSTSASIALIILALITLAGFGWYKTRGATADPSGGTGGARPGPGDDREYKQR